jgi:hypothetical protein
MAKITYTKTVYDIKFRAPQVISEVEFNQYKRFISLNPNASLINEQRSEKSHDKLTGFVLIGVVLLIIGLIGLFGFDSPQWWGGVSMVVSVFGILHPILNGGVYESSKNSVKNFSDEIKFYRELKELIKDSSSYADFNYRYQVKYHFFR